MNEVIIIVVLVTHHYHRRHHHHHYHHRHHHRIIPPSSKQHPFIITGWSPYYRRTRSRSITPPPRKSPRYDERRSMSRSLSRE
ncbi:unnamed protein product [Litomosoides sigmodontis]|uniref:Uncharacterized protein n=1 Tax=Litomosoides sigmodontis TaxID=42156 RepID=A0A3P6UIX0_LITSI|nr:unnamed protein product [Litomosoides sigmodontis]